ncbi:MAG: hypothetical protein ABJM06_03050 [Gilvibacter sp.]
MKKTFSKEVLGLIPLIISGLLCIGLFFALWKKASTDPSFVLIVQSIADKLIYLSVILAGLIMVYLGMTVVNLKNTKTGLKSELNEVTQKMHNFRSIVEILLRSKLWLSGLPSYIDEEFSGLTFFEVKEFYKGNSKLAIEFLQENHNYQDTENLYLEMKSLLYTSARDKKISEEIRMPAVYDKRLIEKWLEHKCGSGLWYYFGYKYNIYKEALDLNTVYERHQEKIMKLALSIDNDTFEDSSFNEVFLSKLGEYATNEILPKLYQLQEGSEQKVPSLVRYLYLISLSLILFGVLLPLAVSLFALPAMASILGVSIIIAVVFFIATAFFQFLSKASQA